MKQFILFCGLLLSMVLPSAASACQHEKEDTKTTHCHLADSEGKDQEQHACCQDQQSQSEHPQHQEAEQSGCAGQGPCCCIAPMLSTMLLHTFYFDFSSPSYQIDIDEQSMPAFLIPSGYSSIFIPPKIS